MEVVIIGSGNVATVLGRLMLANGHRIKQVWSRKAVHAEELSQQLGSEAISDIAKLQKGADLYLLAVTDTAMAETAAHLSLNDELIIHTAGSVSKEVLKGVSTRYGVLWPMKMIRKSMMEIDPVTIVIDGNTGETIREVEKLALEFSAIVTMADDELRVRMHLLAAITSNFTNHLYHLAADYCAAEKIDFSLFYPMIADTALQLQAFHPREVQAGPAFRNDTRTLQKHMDLLQQYPQLLKLYEEFTASIRRQFEHDSYH